MSETSTKVNAFTSLVLFALLAAAFTGTCSDQNTVRTENEIAIDNALTLRVRESLTAGTLVRGINISVDSFKQRVRLAGSVESAEERAEAIRVVENVEAEVLGVRFRVKAVDASNLKVGPG